MVVKKKVGVKKRKPSVKIIGWVKTLVLPFRIDYNNTTKKYYKNLGIGHVALIISRQLKTDIPRIEFKEKGWEVTYRKYVTDFGQKYKKMKSFKTKAEAIKYAKDYMRSHPKG